MRISDWSSDVCSSDLNESVVIAAKVNETVKRVNFDSGDYVEAGAVLVDLSGRVELAELEEARAQFREDEQQLEGNMQLAARQMIPASQIEIGRASCRERVCPYG